MKNKGFTIVELLAVIVILGILSTIALVSVSRYRKDARDMDLTELHSSIEATYDKYRQDMIMKGQVPETKIVFNTTMTEEEESYFGEFTFDGKRLTQEELKGSIIKLVKKGDLLEKDLYLQEVSNNEERYIKDGACLIETSIQTTDGTQKIVKKCKKSNEKPTPSEEEMLCIKIKRNDDEIINDFSNDTSLSQRPLCKYFQND